ncbi:precorrin-6A synthase (deacetylating) [Paracoccus liaowanqingii]|uniref:Precorrin-6A synthase [deacetylating] n=1 Tax=Paracoccus liaowanqingii TaxID=2560053 RepID=A0A4P7HHF1_9RHOB|nr:precorrin-6A synthase (deacetylating) [Paracoccus liaowanqingii]QBX33428.1 precorrin-6A synthase (deacetylating) [Paracoccus liaowanqingii]
MIELVLIGIGTGHPDHLTLEGVHALQEADLVLIPMKGEDKEDLAGLRQQMLARHGVRAVPAPFDLPQREAGDPDYLGAVERWHDAISRAWADRIARHLPGGGRVALLVWGDPMLYDSSLRIAARLPVRVRVIPGITAIQALCAAHAIPLNSLASPVTITTGRQLRDHGWPEGARRVVVMLDGACAFRTLPASNLLIWWGAFLGMPQQILDHGPLEEAGPRIVAARAEARAAHGWIMDCYLLARPD